MTPQVPRLVVERDGVRLVMTTRFYDPQDEGRIPLDEPGTNCDWVARPE